MAASASNNRPTVSGNMFGPERKFSGCAIVAPESSAPRLTGNVWENGLKALTGYIIG